MELKRGIWPYMMQIASSLNRTFMELKHDAEVASNCPKCLNRTFMELKRNSVLPLSPRLNVLIAPLWNWNSVTCPTVTTSRRVLIAPLWNWNSHIAAISARIPRLNRTFMELKHWCFPPRIFRPRYSLNRTFMELKPRYWLPEDGPKAVLIAPLWNWNDRPRLVWVSRRTS